MYTQNCLLLFLWVNIKTMLVEFLLWWKMLMLWKLYLYVLIWKRNNHISFRGDGSYIQIFKLSDSLNSFFIFSVPTIKSILIQQSNHIVVNNLRISFCITTAKFHIIYITIYIATGNGQNIAARVCYVCKTKYCGNLCLFSVRMNHIYKIYIPNITR